MFIYFFYHVEIQVKKKDIKCVCEYGLSVETAAKGE